MLGRREVAEIDGITIHLDTYDGGLFISAYALTQVNEETLKRISEWANRNGKALDLESIYARNCNQWDEQFFSDQDLETVIDSEAVSEKNRQTAHAELLMRANPWLRPRREEVRRIKQHPQTGHVYLVKCGPYYKIGLSTDVNVRLRQIAHSPFVTELVHLIETDDVYTLEKELHEQYADKRRKGEWFELSQQDVTEIMTM